jgi:ParB family chromosome partitioning protein
MAKQAYPGAKRGEVFHVDPLEEGPEGYPYRVVIIGLDTNHKRGEHPFWDPRACAPLEPAFVANVGHYGNRDAVLLRKEKVGTGENDYVFIVIDGRQRTKATRLNAETAKKTGEKAPLLKVETDRSREEVQVGVMISLNEHRHDDGPMVKARKASDLLGQGYDLAAVSNMFGVSRQAISNWQKLATLHKSVQKAVEMGKVSATAAIQLSDLPDADQKTKLAEMIESGATGVDNARRERTGRKNGTKPAAAGKRPGITAIRRVAENDAFIESLSPDAKHILNWVLGDAEAAAGVEGLAAALKGKES